MTIKRGREGAVAGCCEEVRGYLGGYAGWNANIACTCALYCLLASLSKVHM